MSGYKNYIIVKKVDLPEEKKYHGLSKDNEYEHLNTLYSIGIPMGAVPMTEEEAEEVEALPQVFRVYEDQDISIPNPVEADGEVQAVAAQNQIQAPQAWEKGARGKGIRVAVLDTGLDQKHAETTLSKNFIKGETFVNDGTWHDRSSGHGTWCAGAVASEQYGAAPDCELLVAKVLGDNGSGSWSGIIKGINWAVENGARIMSMSLGGSGSVDDPISLAVDAARAKEVITVAAAGNDQRGKQNFTADNHSPGVARTAVTVAAVSVNDQLGVFSSWGNCVELAAPGVNVPGLGLNGTTGAVQSGTSMATPYGAGGFADVLSKKNDIDLAEKVIYTSARDTSLEKYQEGYGILNINAAVDLLPSDPTEPSKPEEYYPELPRLTKSKFYTSRKVEDSVIVYKNEEIGRFEVKK